MSDTRERLLVKLREAGRAETSGEYNRISADAYLDAMREVAREEMLWRIDRMEVALGASNERIERLTERVAALSHVVGFGETQDRGATGAAFVPSRDVAPAGAASVCLPLRQPSED